MDAGPEQCVIEGAVGDSSSRLGGGATMWSGVSYFKIGWLP